MTLQDKKILKFIAMEMNITTTQGMLDYVTHLCDAVGKKKQKEVYNDFKKPFVDERPDLDLLKSK